MPTPTRPIARCATRSCEAADERRVSLDPLRRPGHSLKDTKAFSSDKQKEFSPKYGAFLLSAHHPRASSSTVPPPVPAFRLIIGALSPRAIAGMEPDLIRLVDRLLDAIAAKGRLDLIDDSPPRSRSK